MTKRTDTAGKDRDVWPRGFDGHRRAQVLMGVRLTPAERLRWLEETMETLRRWQGRAGEEQQDRGAPSASDALAGGPLSRNVAGLRKKERF